MKHSMEFELAWQGLKPGVHVYEYEVGKEFMATHGEARSEYKDIHAQVKLRFDKHDGFFQLHFDIGGYIITPCDRCGDDFRMELWDEFDLIVKLTGGDEEHEEAEDADVVFIPRSETVIDVGKWIYEFIVLSIPIQRIHPNDAEGRPGCNEAALKLLGDLTEQKEEKKNDIWKGLESIKIPGNNKRK
jgi:uncharacterized metal-binding protein YceD (DUF177 family)